jgi:uncharacterized Fe-S cluster-containing radical SAM superfamily protein
MKLKVINTEKFSSALRERAIELANGRVLITKFSGSEQEKDFSLPANCGGFGRIHHFRRDQGVDWPSNPLPIDPALRFLGYPPQDEVEVQVFQNAVCSWRCWYCFVDFDLLSANPKHSEFKSAAELLDLYLKESNRPAIIDLSGGQPDLVPEWTVWMLEEIKTRGLSRGVFVWSDDNLSNDFLWRFLSSTHLKTIADSPNYARVGCFKGYDPDSFGFNTSAEPSLFFEQFKLMRRLVLAGFDVYGYATFTSPNTRDVRAKVREFVDRLQCEVHELFPLRTIPLRIREFTPMSRRRQPDQGIALQVQEEAAKAWCEELEARFDADTRSRAIFQHQLVHTRAYGS